MQTNQYDARQFTKGKYLKAIDLDKHRAISVTIQKVAPTDFEGQESKLVLSFLEIDQTMPCNKTQTKLLIEWFGPDIRSWVGKTILLRQGVTLFQGKTVPTIIVDEGATIAPGSRAINLPAEEDNEVLFEEV